MKKSALFILFLLSLAAPFLFPEYRTQLSFLWVMVVFALSWDIVGGQMGYNSFGNILFFGIGMYVTAVVQRNMHYDVEEYVHVAGRVETLASGDYLAGLFLGMGVGAVAAVVIAAILGACILAMGMRGQYFGICTLGLGVAAGEIASGWEYIGAGSGMVTPVFPEVLGEPGDHPVGLKVGQRGRVGPEAGEVRPRERVDRQHAPHNNNAGMDSNTHFNRGHIPLFYFVTEP